MRGHTLLWHNQLPDWLTTGVANGTISNAQLRDLLEQHIFTEVGRYRGRIWQWDVANEFFPTQPLRHQPERLLDLQPRPGHHPAGFHAGRTQADPHALLFYNDYNIAGEDGTNAKSDAVYAWLQQMLDQGVPINGVGDQGHLDTQFGFNRHADDPGPAAVRQPRPEGRHHRSRRPHLREQPDHQVPTDNLAMFAQPYEFGQMLKACLAVPECISFTVWGFGDADSWVPGFFTGEGYATLYDVNLNPKTGLLRTAAGPGSRRLRRAAPVLRRPPRPLAVSPPGSCGRAPARGTRRRGPEALSPGQWSPARQSRRR